MYYIVLADFHCIVPGTRGLDIAREILVTKTVSITGLIFCDFTRMLFFSCILFAVKIYAIILAIEICATILANTSYL